METFATIRDTGQKLREMVLQAAAGYHDEVYLRVLGDAEEVHFVTQSNGRMVMSYCTFADLDHVEGDAEAIIPVGIDSDTKGFVDYLAFAEGSKKVEMRFKGEPGDGDHPHLASHWEAEGALEVSLRLPASRDDLTKVPWGLPDRWTDDNEYLSRAAFDDDMTLQVDDDDLADYTPPTTVETTADTIRKQIVDPAEFVDDVIYRPLIVKDGELRLDLQANDDDDRISGVVNAESVTGPDVDRTFDEGFDELFGQLSGAVRLSTAPDSGDGASPPLVVVQDDRPGRTIRHVLGPFTEE